MTEFNYKPMFPLGKDDTEYKLVLSDHVKVDTFNGKEILSIEPAALELLKNAVISADMIYPMCQDTGTAIVMGKKGQQV